MDDEKRAKVEELLLGGASVNQAAKQAGATWAAAKKVHDELEADGRLTSGEEESAADEATEWELTIQVPKSRVDDILVAFTAQEKADAVAYVLQKRLDDILATDEPGAEG